MHLNKPQLITLPLISPIFSSLLFVCIAAAFVDVHVMYWCNVLCVSLWVIIIINCFSAVCSPLFVSFSALHVFGSSNLSLPYKGRGRVIGLSGRFVH